MNEIGLLASDEPNDKWKSSYFDRYVPIRQTMGHATDLTWLPDFDQWLEELVEYDEQIFYRREISAYNYGDLLIIESALASCRQRIEGLYDYYCMALAALLNFLGELTFTAEEMVKYETELCTSYHDKLVSVDIPEPWFSVFSSTLRKAPDFDLPSLRDVARFIVVTLYRLEMYEEFRGVARCIYNKYKDVVAQVLNESNSMATWKTLIRKLIAHSTMAMTLPVRVPIEKVHRPMIIIGTSDNRAEFRAGRRWETDPAFLRVFSEDELGALVEEQKRIDEVFAHCIVSLGSDDEALELIEQELEEIHRTQGRVAARQKLRFRFRTQLSIPRFKYDELDRSLRQSQ